MTGDAGRIRVAVVGGGQNCEHDVSLASAASVADALNRELYDVVAITIGAQGEWSVDGDEVGLPHAVGLLQSCDVVFPAVHGPRGEDGALAALCEFAGVPYVGAGVRAGALAMDKWATKLLASSLGIATAAARVIARAERGTVAWVGPVVVKPVAAGSSRGVTLVRAPDAFDAALAEAFAFDDRVLLEEVVTGREVDVAVLGDRRGRRWVSPPLEIVTDGVFDYDTKYGGRARFLVPAPLVDTARKRVEDAALRMYDALGCSGVARVDFFLTDDGPVLNEVNTMPGMTSASQVPKMFAAGGLCYGDLLTSLISAAFTDASRSGSPGSGR